MTTSPSSNPPSPFKGAKLFIDGGNYYEFSHIGWGTYFTQFDSYASGYKAAGDTLIEAAIHSKNISILDTTLYPAAFLYRQYLELTMKSIYIRYSSKSKEDKVQNIKGIKHSLLCIWKEVKPLFSENASPADLADIDVVEDYLNEFQQVDSSSLTFRYPIDKQLQQTIVPLRRVNLVNLRERMNELDAFFKGCEGKLSEIAGWRLDEAEALLSAIY